MSSCEKCWVEAGNNMTGDKAREYQRLIKIRDCTPEEQAGPDARPMKPEWARSIRDQCAEAGVPFFMKQMSKKASIPDDLMIREYPEVKQ